MQIQIQTQWQNMRLFTANTQEQCIDYQAQIQKRFQILLQIQKMQIQIQIKRDGDTTTNDWLASH